MFVVNSYILALSHLFLAIFSSSNASFCYLLSCICYLKVPSGFRVNRAEIQNFIFLCQCRNFGWGISSITGKKAAEVVLQTSYPGG